MFGLTVWSTTTVVAIIVVGTLLIHQVRRRLRTSTPRSTVVDDKTVYSDEGDRRTTNGRYKPGLPLPSSIVASHHETIDRGQWVLRMTRHVFNERHEGQHNVVVINKELEYHFDIEGIVERHHAKYYEPPSSRLVPYDVVVFREGVLHNMGDGGDINWDWMGNFERHGTGMLVFKPCQHDKRYLQDPWIASID